MLKKKPESAKNVASRAPSPRDLEKSAQNFRKVGVSASILAKKLMTNRLAGCVRRSFLKIKISQMQYDRGILLHERPQPHPSCRPSSTPGDKRGKTPRRDERKKRGCSDSGATESCRPTRVSPKPTHQRAASKPPGWRQCSPSEAGPEAHSLACSLHATRYPRSR